MEREVIFIKGPLFDQVLHKAHIACNQMIRRKLAEQGSGFLATQTQNATQGKEAAHSKEPMEA